MTSRAANLRRAAFVTAGLAGTLFVIPPTAEAQCLAPGRWAYGSCGSVSSGVRAAPRYNYGGAAAAGVAVLGAIMEHAEAERRAQQAGRDAADRARRAARAAECRRNYESAYASNDEANQVLDRWDPGGAIPHYERALSLLGRCGDAHNQGIVRRNLEIARKQYAAFRPDDRVSDAQAKYADQNIYTSDNPFKALPRSTSGASAPGVWDGTRENCEVAGEVDRGTAAWYDMCVWDGTKAPARYQPRIDPQLLSRRARETCSSAAEETRNQCVIEAKTRILMTEDAEIRRRCAGAAEQVVECVDIAYVYGPDGEGQYLRAVFKWQFTRLHGTTRPPSGTVVRGCHAGSPGATCRPYGGAGGIGAENAPGAAAQASAREIENASAAAMASYRARLFTNVAAAAVAAATREVESGLPSKDRRDCVDAALAAVRSEMGGLTAGATPQRCAALVDVARSKLAYYAAARVDTGPTPHDDPLADYLAAISTHSGGTNKGDLDVRKGLDGLAPDERMRAQGECLRRGGSAADCAK